MIRAEAYRKDLIFNYELQLQSLRRHLNLAVEQERQTYNTPVSLNYNPVIFIKSQIKVTEQLLEQAKNLI